jgi:hypothetical protein
VCVCLFVCVCVGVEGLWVWVDVGECGGEFVCGWVLRACMHLCLCVDG